jgi:hypothetical protein
LGRQTSRPRVRTSPFRIRLRATERAAQPNPTPVGSALQSEMGAALLERRRTAWLRRGSVKVT